MSTDEPLIPNPNERPMRLQGVNVEVYHCNEPEVLVSGPRGTAKTYTDMLRTISLCKIYPGSRHLFARYVRAHMPETVLETWERLLGPNHPTIAGAAGRANRNTPYQVYDSEVIVRGLDDPIATNSGEFDTITLFEATDIPEKTYYNLFGTLRHGKMIASDGRSWHQMRAECNPSAPSHWLKRRADAGEMVHYPTTHRDNPAYWDARAGCLTPEGERYVAVLQRMTGVIYKRNYLGLWAGAEGMIFENWDESRHVIDQMPRESSHWWRIRAIDFGYTNPSVCQWWAIDPKNCTMILERELVRVKTDSVAFAQEIIKHTPCPELVIRTVADHEDANARSVLLRAGVQTVGCEKPRHLNDWPVHLGAIMRRLDGDEHGPTQLVLRSALIDRDPRAGAIPLGLLEERPSYQWEPAKEGRSPREKPVDKDDHSENCCRYATRFVDQYFRPGMAPEMVVPPSPFPKIDRQQQRKLQTWVPPRFTKGRA